MSYVLDNRDSIISLNDKWYRLISIDDNSLTFEISYYLNANKALTNGVNCVEISVYKSRAKSKQNNIDVNKPKNAVELIKNRWLNSVSNYEKKESSLLKRQLSDITSYIDNTNVKSILNNEKKYKKSFTLTTVEELNKKNISVPVLSSTNLTVDRSIYVDSQLENYKMLRAGIDPSTVTIMTHTTTTSYDSYNGLNKKVRSSTENNSLTKLFSTLLESDQKKIESSNDLNSSDLIAVTELVDSNIVIISEEITFAVDNSDIENVISSFVVDLNVISSKIKGKQQERTVVQTISSIISADSIKSFYIPTEAPKVNFSNSSLHASVSVEIKQIDPIASGVKIYKKVIKNTCEEYAASTLIGSAKKENDYILIGNVKIKANSQNSVTYNLSLPISDAIFLYRIIPYGELGDLGAEYTNVVVLPKKGKSAPIKSSILIPQIIDSGHKINIKKLPPEAISVQLLYRDITLNEANFNNSLDIVLVDFLSKNSNSFELTNTNVKNNHVYEYALKSFFKDGTISISGYTTVEYKKKSVGLVEISLDNLNVSVLNDSSPDVTFDISTKLVSTNIDDINKLLEEKGILDYFKGDIEAERDKLSSLIAYDIIRTNMSTGEKEYMGLTTEKTFTDSVARKNTSAKSLSISDVYQYEIIPLIRNAETILEEYVKTKVTNDFQKEYSFKPYIYRHPLALEDGTIIGDQMLAGNKNSRLYAKAPFQFGDIGASESLVIDFSSKLPAISEIIVSRLDKRTNILTWTLNGEGRLIDHFIIIKSLYGIKTIIGKCHSEFENNICTFYHKLTSRDIGPIKYLIIPVMGDYSIGTPLTTEEIVVEI